MPEDIAVVGFDDNMLSGYVRPPLTTIHQPFIEMGRTAGHILLTMIEPDHPRTQRQAQHVGELAVSPQGINPVTQHPIRVQLPTSMIVRESSGALQAISP